MKWELKMSEISHEQVVDYLSNLSVMDIVSLTKDLEEKWGVSAAPVAVAGGMAAGGDAGAAAAEEQTEFDVELTSFGEKKINVIKAIREITSLGLKEAKAVVDAAPKVIKEAVTKEEAEETKKKLEDAGATVTVK